MYISRSQYGHKQYTNFTLGPDTEIKMQGWRIWRTTIGYFAEFTCYRDWSRARTYTITDWAFTKRGARNRLAKKIRKWRRLEERYFKSRQESR